MRKFLVAAAALLASTAMPAAAAELITNGDFESGSAGLSGNVLVIVGQAYVTNAGGSGSPAARANHFASFGAGNVAGLGTVSRTFNTVAGQTYTLSFDYGAFNPTSQQLSYSLAGISGSSVLSSTVGTTILDNIFTNFSTTFIGNGASTTLSFQSTSAAGDNADILLDNLSVTGAVPEPATWAMMLVGFGMVGFGLRSRRKQSVRVTYA